MPSTSKTRGPLRDDVGFFQAVQANLRKYTVGGGGKSNTELGTAIKQLVSGAIISDEVIDIFDAAGLKNPDLSILSDECLETVRQGEHVNF